VGRQPKVLIPIAVVVALAGLAWWQLGLLVAVAVAVGGGLLAVVVLRRLGERHGSSALDVLDEATEVTEAPLQPWSPPEPLQPWTPPEPAGTTTDWEAGTDWQDGSTWDSRDVALDANPLDELDRLDDVDVVAEVERLEATTFHEDIWETDLDAADGDREGSASVTTLSVPRINEDVHTAEDIMAASHATELSITGSGPGDNSELAKLLAKVQARLAAYE